MFYYFGPIDYYEFMQHQIYHHLFVYHFDNCLRNTLLPEKRFCHIHTDILTRVSSGAPDILVYWYKKTLENHYTSINPYTGYQWFVPVKAV